MSLEMNRRQAMVLRTASVAALAVSEQASAAKGKLLEMTDLAGSAQHVGQLEQARTFHNEYVDLIEPHPKYQSCVKV